MVSIIVPIYNVEKFLKECLESIVNQTYRDLEIILVDDGSPDNCGKICDEYAEKDTRIKVIHKENGGVSSARNVGLSAVTGEYISFIDPDDVVSNDFIKKLLYLSQSNNCDIAECNFVSFENEIILDDSNLNVELVSPLDIQKELFSDDSVKAVVLWNKIYKKYLFDNIQFPFGKINEDEYAMYRVIYNCKTKIAVTNESLYYYRTNHNSIMRRKYNVSRHDSIGACKEQKEFYMKNNEKELFDRVVIKFQTRLEWIFILTIENIEKPKNYLFNIKNEMNENLKDFIKIKNISLVKKIRAILFTKMPYLYYNLTKIRCRKKYLSRNESE